MTQLTEQETFEKVVRHLFTQGKRAVNREGLCMYRGPDGLKCAIGCLIPDYLYRPRMEDQVLHSVWASVPDLIQDYEFMNELQYLHDHEQNWTDDVVMQNAAIQFAVSYNLDAGFVKELSFNKKPE